MNTNWQFHCLYRWIVIPVGTLAILCGSLDDSPARADDQAPPPTTHPQKQYVDAAEQMIIELYVRDVQRSTAFYERLGFTAVRKEPTFVELGWDDSRIYLEQIPDQPAPPTTLVANVRIMVADVDRYWTLCQEMKLPVKRAIGDRYYGLRDFTVVSPDGIGLRFASKLRNGDR